MTLAVMQPYFLPYLGYFQLMAAVDKFIFLDDVNYINRGWVNRNRIPAGETTAWLTIPLVGASQNRLISEIEILPDNGWKARMIRTVETTYRRAPFFDAVFPLFQDWVSAAAGGLSPFLSSQLQLLAEWLGLATSFSRASVLHPRADARGQDRILEICMAEKADIYVNPPGGVNLYDASFFETKDIGLEFLQPRLEGLGLAHGGTEGPVLSVLDLMMHNSQTVLCQAVAQFKTIPAIQ